MKNVSRWGGVAALYVVVAAVVLSLMFWLFHSSEFFRALFFDQVAAPGAVAGEADPAQVAAEVKAVTETAGNLSFGILLFILMLQIFAFLTAFLVFLGISKSQDPLVLRLKHLENADLFLDLPLYFGLFGTVSSFVIMSFNPQVSRLIAYSSTLVGIIFSVVLRLALQYPIRRRFLGEPGAEAVLAKRS